MSAAFTNLAISLGAMQCTSIHSLLNVFSLSVVAKKVPFDDPQVLLYVRIGYVVAQLTVLGVFYYVSTLVRRFSCLLDCPSPLSQVKKKNDMTVLKYGASPRSSPMPFTHVPLVEPANPMVRYMIPQVSRSL